MSYSGPIFAKWNANASKQSVPVNLRWGVCDFQTCCESGPEHIRISTLDTCSLLLLQTVYSFYVKIEVAVAYIGRSHKMAFEGNF